LAAFLTSSISARMNYVKDMQTAISRGYTICASSPLESEFRGIWPNANFVYLDGSKKVLQAFDNGDCEGIIYPLPDLLGSHETMKFFCDKKLIMVGNPVLEIPVGFPVCSELAAGISYWISEAKKQGISYESYDEKARPPKVCNFEISNKLERNEMDGLTINDLALPILVVIIFAILAIFFHALTLGQEKKAKNAKNINTESGVFYSKRKQAKSSMLGDSMLGDSMLVDSMLVDSQTDNTISISNDIEKILDETKRILLEKVAVAAINQSNDEITC